MRPTAGPDRSTHDDHRPRDHHRRTAPALVGAAACIRRRSGTRATSSGRGRARAAAPGLLIAAGGTLPPCVGRNCCLRGDRRLMIVTKAPVPPVRGRPCAPGDDHRSAAASMRRCCGRLLDDVLRDVIVARCTVRPRAGRKRSVRDDRGRRDRRPRIGSALVGASPCILGRSSVGGGRTAQVPVSRPPATVGRDRLHDRRGVHSFALRRAEVSRSRRSTWRVRRRSIGCALVRASPCIW